MPPPEDSHIARDQRFIDHIVDVLQDNVQGSDWAAPEGSVIVDALICMVHVDGNGSYVTTWLSKGSEESAEGMARRVIRDINASSMARLMTHFLEEDDD